MGKEAGVPVHARGIRPVLGRGEERTEWTEGLWPGISDLCTHEGVEDRFSFFGWFSR